MPNQKKPDLTFQKILELAISWNKTDEGFIAYTKSPNGGVYGYNVTTEMLATVSTSLADDLAIMFSGTKDLIVKNRMDGLIHLLQKKDVLLMTALNGATYLVKEIEDLNFSLLENDELVSISGDIYAISYASSLATRSVRTIINFGAYTIAVRTKELTRHFPDWEQAYAIGSGLGLTKENLTSLITATRSACPVSTQNVVLPALELLGSF